MIYYYTDKKCESRGNDRSGGGRGKVLVGGLWRCLGHVQAAALPDVDGRSILSPSRMLMEKRKNLCQEG